MKIAFASQVGRTHGDSGTRMCKTWYSIRRRAFNTHNPRFKDYGGRGIKLCDRWLDYENFKSDMQQSYIEHVREFGEFDTTIERKDVDGDYCPENCTWATREEQGSNKRNTVKLNYHGETFTLRQLSENFNINYYALKDRIYRGWDIESSLTIPVRKPTNSEGVQLK